MKLRQKLAMALAAAMVVTAVPVTTMAASTNAFSTTISIIKDQVITTDEELTLDFDITGGVKESEKVFFIEAEDFQFVDADGDELTNDAFTTDGTNFPAGFDKIEVLSKTQIRVTLDETTADVEVNLPVAGKVTGETPALIVDGERSAVSGGKYTFTTSAIQDKALVATVGDATSISIDGVGTIADIKIEEVVAGKLDDKIIKIELDRSSDLVFDYKKNDTITTKGDRGHAGAAGTATVVEINADKDEMYVQFTGLGSNQRGSVTLEDIKVTAEDDREDVKTGDVEVTISAAKFEDNKYKSDDFFAEIEAVVANVNEFDAKLTVKDDKAVEFIAGGAAKEVTIKLAELAAGTFEDRDNVYFTIEGAKLIEINEEAIADHKDDADFEYKAFDEEMKDSNGNDVESVLTYDKDDEEIRLDLSGVNEEKISSFEFKLKVAAEPGSTDDIVVKAESKVFDDVKEVVVGTVTEDRTIETEVAQLNVGEKGQVAGQITIAETEAETFEDGEIIYIELEEDAADDNISIEDFETEVTEDSGLEIEEYKVVYVDADGDFTVVKADADKDKDGDEIVAENVIAVEVVRESDEAATLTIKEIEFDTNNSTPEGGYKAILTGSLISEEGSKVEVEDFVVVGEKNVNVGTEKEVTVTIDSKEYTVDGEVKEAIAAPYAVAGRTMVPLRFVSEEFGAKVDFGTIDGVGTITINKDGKVIQFKNGSNVMNQNGILVPMDAEAVVKDGTTFVPFRYLANALEVDFTWDDATKSITFMN